MTVENPSNQDAPTATSIVDQPVIMRNAVEKEPSMVPSEVSVMVEEPHRPWYYFDGVKIAQGYNLVSEKYGVRMISLTIKYLFYSPWESTLEWIGSRSSRYVKHFSVNILRLLGTRRGGLRG